MTGASPSGFAPKLRYRRRTRAAQMCHKRRNSGGTQRRCGVNRQTKPFARQNQADDKQQHRKNDAGCQSARKRRLAVKTRRRKSARCRRQRKRNYRKRRQIFVRVFKVICRRTQHQKKSRGCKIGNSYCHNRAFKKFCIHFHAHPAISCCNIDMRGRCLL